MLRVEGRIVNHDAEFDGAVEINTETGLIEQVGPSEGRSDIDLTGCLIFPGFGDLHIHAREDASGTQAYKEDFSSASAAAVHGGVTHVADMPNNPIAPIDDTTYRTKEILTQKSDVHVTLYAGIGHRRIRSTGMFRTRRLWVPQLGTYFLLRRPNSRQPSQSTAEKTSVFTAKTQ